MDGGQVYWRVVACDHNTATITSHPSRDTKHKLRDLLHKFLNTQTHFLGLNMGVSGVSEPNKGRIEQFPLTKYHALLSVKAGDPIAPAIERLQGWIAAHQPEEHSMAGIDFDKHGVTITSIGEGLLSRPFECSFQGKGGMLKAYVKFGRINGKIFAPRLAIPESVEKELFPCTSIFNKVFRAIEGAGQVPDSQSAMAFIVLEKDTEGTLTGKVEIHMLPVTPEKKKNKCFIPIAYRTKDGRTIQVNRGNVLVHEINIRGKTLFFESTL